MAASEQAATATVHSTRETHPAANGTRPRARSMPRPADCFRLKAEATGSAEAHGGAPRCVFRLKGEAPRSTATSQSPGGAQTRLRGLGPPRAAREIVAS